MVHVINCYKVIIELIDERDQDFPVAQNDSTPASIVTTTNEERPSVDCALLNMGKQNKQNKPQTKQ